MSGYSKILFLNNKKVSSIADIAVALVPEKLASFPECHRRRAEQARDLKIRVRKI